MGKKLPSLHRMSLSSFILILGFPRTVKSAEAFSEKPTFLDTQISKPNWWSALQKHNFAIIRFCFQKNKQKRFMPRRR